MVTITPANATEFEHMKFCTEASSVGIRPGSFPTAIPTTLGNGENFYYTSMATNAAGEIVYWRYRQSLGCIWLHVLND